MHSTSEGLQYLGVGCKGLQCLARDGAQQVSVLAQRPLQRERPCTAHTCIRPSSSPPVEGCRLTCSCTSCTAHCYGVTQ